MRITTNSFIQGKNTDQDRQQIPPVFATDIQNLSLVENGSFLALKNIRGTTNVQDVIALSGTEVLGVFETKYKIGDVSDIKCLTIIVATAGLALNIFCYDTENDDLYQLYNENIESDYLTDDRVVDAVRYAENGLDILYLSDFYNEIRQLRCEIPLPYSANFLNDSDLSLQRRGANGTVDLDSTPTGGSLLSGTYQFAYRMVDPEKKKFTKWSSLTNPIHVYIEDDTNNISYSGIGLPTDRKIIVDVNPTAEELANFPNFQLAVVENLFPYGPTRSGNDSIGYTYQASLLEVKLISEIAGVEYASNNKVGIIPIEDITVDLAPIETVKTLNVQLNKLFAGNVKYRPLELDNGVPTVTSGYVESAASNRTYYYEQINSSRTVGYFRDEVYRFGIVYIDKYGNKSAPVALDLSGITDNQITGGLKDIKFPSRSTSNSYSIVDTNDGIRVIGLQLNDIVNHPTWAVGFEIVRVKRIKSIQFQTPIIPGERITGIGAFSRYPTIINLTNDDEDTKDYPDAQPMTSSTIVVPKNLFWPELRDITKRDTSIGGVDYTSSSFNQCVKGEAQIKPRTTGFPSVSAGYDQAYLFPQSDMYGDTPYNFLGNESIKTIDFCILRLNSVEYNEDEVDDQTGNHINTKISGNFYALRNGDYYFDGAWVGKTLAPDTTQITEYQMIPNLGEGIVLGGSMVNKFDELSTKGVPLGYAPTNQKIGAVKLKAELNDNSTTKTFVNGVRNNYQGGDYIFGSSGPRYEEFSESATGSISNLFVNEYSGYGTSSYVQMLRIANVVRGEIGDNRYGDMDDQHEYISTGAKYSFTPSELADVEQGVSTPISIPVWGGDCFIGYHIFKISDSTYSVVNQTKNNFDADSNPNLRKRWNNILYSYPNNANPNPKLMMPVALEGAAQFIQLYLESEYNGEVRDYDVLSKVAAVGNKPIFNVTSEASIRTPLTYNYNINLSKQNDQKVYFSTPPNFVQQNEFEGRIVISDQKVYNSDTQGFDIFRVLNFFDLDESGGHLTKLGLAGDSLYGIQEKQITYLPVGSAQIEQTDAGILSVGTGGDIGRPIVIDTNKGSQHLRGIIETGNQLYIPDNRNKSVYTLAGTELKPISELFNATLWRNKFSTVIPEKDLIAVYDPFRHEYWLSGEDFCERFNETLGAWHGNMEFRDELKGGVATNQGLFLIGTVGSQVSVYTAYTGNYGQLFGTTVVPRVSFVVNPDSPYEKTFDNMMFEATDRFDEIDFLVERESALSNQSGTIIVSTLPQKGGNYRIDIMRDASNARLRGLRMLATLKWKTGSTDTSTLTSVTSKYRLAARRPF